MKAKKLWLGGGALGLVVLLALAATQRGGLLALPSVPRGFATAATGIANLGALSERARALESGGAGDAALAAAATGLAALDRGEIDAGLESLRDAVRRSPDDLVLGNAYRMAVFRLRRDVLRDPAPTTLAASMPAPLAGEPIAFLEQLVREHPSRETELQLALAWVDEMLLFPALEIKAPASVESVRLLSGILEREPAYVPALYGRGLNYLHRPARLVWPEAQKAPHDAASYDLGLGMAIGRKVGSAPPRLVGTMALALGDAYAKEGRAGRARSWWQIAQNACRDDDLGAAIERRWGWGDAELLDALEEELQTQMRDLEHPMTDLAFLWPSP